MSHDPLCAISGGPCCPWMGECDCQCTCDLIGKVRKDEADRVMSLRYQQVTGWQDMKEALAWQQGQRDMLAKCIAAVDEVGNKAGSWRPSDQPSEDYFVAVVDAIAALQALQEKP